MQTSFSFFIPMHLMSIANIKEHWAKRSDRNKKQCRVTRSELEKIDFPKNLDFKRYDIQLVRVAPRKLDTDNLPFAMKHIRDCLADMIVPGLAPGRADDDARITWQYAQQKSKKLLYGFVISINQYHQ